MEQINLKVREETKQEWNDYVDENDEFTGLSGLIRMSVHEYISNDRQARASTQAQAGTEEIKEEIQKTKEEIEDELDDIHLRILDIQTKIEKDREELREISNKILDNIPGKVATEDEGLITKNGISKEQLVQETGYDERTIGKAAEILREEVSNLKTKEIGGELYYYRRD
jgi:peptidoglycan hydrolase CwlO-like protein